MNDVCRQSPPAVLAKIQRSCRYHRGRSARPGSVFACAPAGSCQALLGSVHSHAMRLMYSSDRSKIDGLVCPAGKVTCSVSAVRRFPASMVPLARLAVEVARTVLGRSAEIPEFRCRVSVDRVRSGCPQGLILGTVIGYNLTDRTTLCPASLHNLFPFLVRTDPARSARTARFARLHAVCPDPEGVEYSIAAAAADICASRNRALPFIPRTRGWPVRPDGFCPAAFHSIFPYLYVLAQGGRFGWLKKNDPVRVSCPSPHGIVMEAGKTGKGKDVYVRIEGGRGDCPAGLKQGSVLLRW